MARSKISLAIENLLIYYSFTGHWDKTLRPASISEDAPGVAPSGGSSSSEDHSEDAVGVRVVRDLMLDITEGASFLSTIADDEEIVAANKKDRLIRVCYESTPGFSSDSPIMVGPKSGKPGHGAIPPGTPYSVASIIAAVNKPTSEAASTYQDAEVETETTPAGFTLKRDIAINTNVAQPDKFMSPSLGAILVDKLTCGFGTRNADAVALFMNGIPTIEMSRCTPYIDLRFITDTPAVSTADTGGSVNGLSLLKFLGVYQVGDGSSGKTNFGLASAKPANLIDPLEGLSAFGGAPTDNPHATIANAGMELFTSPQTLVNPSINAGLMYDTTGEGSLNSRTAVGLPPVIDPFQPFMTLIGLKISQLGTGKGEISHVVGTISLRLHDRSRMAELGPLLNVNQFSLLNIALEFGWSHPEGINTVSPTNDYAVFLNSLRRREKIKLKSGTYTLLPDGQVDIELGIAGFGGQFANSVSIATGRYVPLNLVTSIINNTISTELTKLEGRQLRESPFVTKTLNAGSLTEGTTMVPRSVLTKSLEIIRSTQYGETGSVDKLLELLEELVGKDGNEGVDTPGERASAATVIKEKIDGLYPKSGTPDPFLTDFDVPLSGYPLHRTSTPVADPDSPPEVSDAEEQTVMGAPYVSLGKVALSMIGAPLTATHRFDEVQLLFYPFNARSGAMHKANIASFPISVADITKKLQSLGQSGDTVTSNVVSILSDYLSDPNAPAYGCSDVFQTAEEVTDATPVVGSKMAKRLHQLGCMFDELDPCKLNVYYETVPTFDIDVKNPEIKNARFNRNILRVHFYDEESTPYEGSKYVLGLTSKQNLTNIIRDGLEKTAVKEEADADSAPKTGAGDSVMRALGREDIVKKIESGDITDLEVYKVIASYENLKAFIMSEVPSIIFGAAFSPVETVTVGGGISGELVTAMTSNAISQENKESAQAPSGGPMVGEISVIPASVSMTMMGCPLIGYGQQFFLDLGTGTDADNIYRVTSVTHTFGETGFKTSLSLGFTQTASAKTIRGQLKQQIIALSEAQKVVTT
jgi:hypothetical protein